MVVDGGCGSSSHHIVELRTDVPWISDEKTKTRMKKNTPRPKRRVLTRLLGHVVEGEGGSSEIEGQHTLR